MAADPLLPHELGTDFSVSGARAVGVKRSAIDHPALLRHYRGARSVPRRHEHHHDQPRQKSHEDHDQWPGSTALPPWELELLEAEARVAALWPLAPEYAFFYGPTAAFLWGAPLPQGQLQQLHLAVPYPRSAMNRPGVTSTRIRPHLADVIDGTRYRALSVETTWTSLAPFLNLDDLVAVADFFIAGSDDPGGRHPERVRPAATTLEQLGVAISRGKWVGAQKLRDALRLARAGSRSRRETHLRLRLGAAGLPEPVLNQDIVEQGVWLACPDIKYPDYRVGVEYQSAYHRSAAQYDADIDRRLRLAEAGWLMVELTDTHVTRSPQECVRRVSKALRQRGWLG